MHKLLVSLLMLAAAGSVIGATPAELQTRLANEAKAADADKAERFTLDETYRQECGECHVAYPPALLQRDAWRQVMHRLDRHYGGDASLDGALATRLMQWLETHAGSKARFAGAGDPPRITQTSWFRHEHDEAPQAARRNAGSMARCEACHRGAAQGDYRESGIRLPSRLPGGQP